MLKPQLSKTAPQGGSDAAHATTEVRIEFFPFGYDEWQGTKAALTTAGVVSSDVAWPDGRGCLRWTSGGFEHLLMRVKPDGHKGPMSSWLDCDNFLVRRSLASRGRDGFAAAILHEKRQAYEAELFRQSDAGRQLAASYWKALDDKRFRRFLAVVAPQASDGRRGRSVKPPTRPT